MDVRIALMGFGNVGQGLAGLLADHGEEYRGQYGVRLLLTCVADRGGAALDSRGLDPASLLSAKRRNGTVAADREGIERLAAADLLDRAGAQVLVEAASTNFEDAEPGWSTIRDAIARHMDIVLASKGALVLYFDELMSLAEESGVRVAYAGTVGAPLPVLELSERVLVGADIVGFEGILNATTNQILTSMQQGSTYEEGLRVAQEIGVAETDPTLDVDGWDAAAKAVIISRAVFGSTTGLGQVNRTGIRQVTQEDLRRAARSSRTIKLIVRIERDAAGVRATVAPEERELTDVLGKLEGQQMGAVFRTSKLGDVSTTVQQTGGVPTALTVLRDVVNLARQRGWMSRP